MLINIHIEVTDFSPHLAKVLVSYFDLEDGTGDLESDIIESIQRATGFQDIKVRVSQVDMIEGKENP